jgi:tetratricopeptide (TPR) repeat protein
VKSSLISQEQLEDAIAFQAKVRDKRLGEILLERDLITREDLHRHIRIQIEEAVYFLFTWSQGTFNFEADILPEEQDLLVSINPESLLLEGARRVDEWSLIEKKIPSFDVVFALDRDRLEGSEVELTQEQDQLLPLIDGRRDVTAIIDESGMAEFSVGKALYALQTAGFLHRVGKSKPAAAAAVDGKVEEHRNLGIAFYKTGMLEEALREFRRVLELNEADLTAQFYLGLAFARQGKWPESAETLRAASKQPGAKGAVFHNLSFALERLGRFEEARSELEEAMLRGGSEDPRMHTSLGVLTLRLGNAVGADEILTAARSLCGARPPSAAWFHYAALAAALTGDVPRSIALLTEGIGHHPHAAALFNNLAAAHERRGNHQEAASSAERGAHEDSGIPQLHKNIGDYYYRASQYDEALESYQRAVKLDPSLGGDIFLKLGNIRLRRRETEEAIRCWERALELDPGNSIIRTNLNAVRGAA